MLSIKPLNGYDVPDGTVDYVDTGEDSLFDFPTGGFSVSTWFKTDGSLGDRLVSKDGSGLSFELNIAGSGGVIGYVDDGVDACCDGVLDSRRDYEDGNWHHAVLVVDSSNVELFVDGSSGGTVSHDNSLLTNNNNVHVGRMANTANNYFDGQIDEVKIFNYALTQEQILTEYNEGAVYFGP